MKKSLLIVLLCMIASSVMAQSLKKKNIVPPVEPAKQIKLISQECVDLSKTCGFVKDKDLEKKVKDIVVESMRDSLATNFINYNIPANRDKTCDRRCAESGKRCIAALRGEHNSRSGAEYDYDEARIWAPVECVSEHSSSNVIQWCLCI